MCVCVIYNSFHFHSRMRTFFRILIFSITDVSFKNIFSLNRFFDFTIVLICWFFNVFNTSNRFFIMSISNTRSFYLFVHYYNICRIFSIFLIDSSFCFSVTTSTSTSSLIFLTCIEAFIVTIYVATGSYV